MKHSGKLVPARDILNSEIPLWHEFPSHIKRKNILFVGPTGVGKSTMVNVLHNDSPDQFPLYDDKESIVGTYPADAIPRTQGVTSNFHTYYSHLSRLVLTDTVGFGDARFDPNQLLKSFRYLLMWGKEGYNKIYIVLKYPKQDVSVRQYLSFLKKLFGNIPKEHIALIWTHYPLDKPQQRFIEENKNDADIKDLMNSVGNTLFLNFQSDEYRLELDKFFRVDRKKSLATLKADVQAAPDNYIRPITWGVIDLVCYYITTFFPKNTFSIDSLKAMYSALNEERTYGSCGFCYELITEIPAYSPCGHHYHPDCLARLANTSSLCLVCNAFISVRPLGLSLPQLSGPPYQFFPVDYVLPDTIDVHQMIEIAYRSETLSNPESVRDMKKKVNTHFKRNFVKKFQEEHHLSSDQTKAILYYIVSAPQQEDSLFSKMNTLLSKRPEKRSLEPWQPYIHLLFSGLKKLPKFEGTVYRGYSVQLLRGDYDWVKWHDEKQAVLCITVTSTDKKEKTFQNFAPPDRPGTWVKFTVTEGRDVSKLRFYNSEDEVILLPNSVFVIESIDRDFLCGEFTSTPGPTTDLIKVFQRNTILI